MGVTTAARRIEELYRDQGTRMWRALLAYTGNPDIASDALAEAFTQAIARGDDVKDPASWIWTAAFRIGAGQLKDERRGVPFGTLDMGYDVADPVPHLFEALSRISPNQRLAVVLHDYADRPTEEIARILGITRPTVHVHLSKGRQRLRQLLEEADG